MKKIITLLLIAIIHLGCTAQESCKQVDRSLTSTQKLLLAPVIAKQLGVPKTNILESFRLNEWSVIFVDTHQSDEVYLFYAHDPMKSKFITMWSGAARSDEGPAIKDWVIKNAKNIPDGLASCFAAHATEH